MGDLLSLIRNTLSADETALSVASENTAGASSATYHAERATLAAVPAGADPLGAASPPPPNGMEVVTIERMSDPTAAAGLLHAMGSAALASTALQGLSPIETAFAANASGGVQDALQTLQTAWNAYEDAPTSLGAAQALYGSAGQVAQAVNVLQGQLSGVADTLIAQASRQAGQFGSLLGQIATTQQALASLPPDTTAAGSLLDQVDALTEQLAQLGGAVSHPTEGLKRLIAAPGDGPVWVDGSQVPLMTSTGAVLNTLVTSSGPWYTASVSFTAGHTVAFDPAFGELAGTLQALGTVESFGAELAGLSQTLASTVPANPSTALFVTTGGAGLYINPSVSAQSLQASVAAQAEPALGAALNQWGTIAAGVGTVTHELTASATAAAAGVTGYQEALQKVIGVDPNQAAVSVIEDQQAFQAAAQLLATQQSLMTTLLQAVA